MQTGSGGNLPNTTSGPCRLVLSAFWQNVVVDDRVEFVTCPKEISCSSGLAPDAPMPGALAVVPFGSRGARRRRSLRPIGRCSPPGRNAHHLAVWNNGPHSCLAARPALSSSKSGARQGLGGGSSTTRGVRRRGIDGGAAGTAAAVGTIRRRRKVAPTGPFGPYLPRRGRGSISPTIAAASFLLLRHSHGRTTPSDERMAAWLSSVPMAAGVLTTM